MRWWKRVEVWCVLVLIFCALGCNREEQKGERLGPPCGGLEGDLCSRDAYCRLKPGCGGIDKEGTCQIRPQECPYEKQEICGCDGKTYSSQCVAAMRGVSVRDVGACPVGE